MEIVIGILIVVIIVISIKLQLALIKLNQAQSIINNLKVEKKLYYKMTTDWANKYTDLINSLTTLDYYDSFGEGELLNLKKVLNKKLKKYKNEVISNITTNVND